MLKDMTIGQYYPVDSPIHELDPRIKIIATFVFMVSLFIINKFWPYVLVLVSLVSAITIIKYTY